MWLDLARNGDGSVIIKIHPPIDHVRHVTIRGEELHHRLAGPRHLSLSRLRIRILLKAPYIVPIEYKVHLTQVTLWSLPNGVTLCASQDHVVVLEKGLPPDINQYLLEGNGHWNLCSQSATRFYAL
jgi:hypothetical protein